MKILKTSCFSFLLLVSAISGVKAVSPVKEPVKVKEVQEGAQKKGTKKQELGKELLKLLKDAAEKHVKQNCPCCPGATVKDGDKLDESKTIKKAKDLIAKGADVNIIGENGVSSLYLAVMLDSVELVTVLLEKKVKIVDVNGIASPLITNILLRGSKEIAKKLIASGANVNFQMNKTWHTPLIAAATFNDLEVAKLLIEKGADVNTKATMKIQDVELCFTALGIAVSMQKKDMVEFLLANGADVNVKINDGTSKEGKTILELAKKADNKEMIDLLLKK